MRKVILRINFGISLSRRINKLNHSNNCFTHNFSILIYPLAIESCLSLLDAFLSKQFMYLIYIKTKLALCSLLSVADPDNFATDPGSIFQKINSDYFVRCFAL